MSSAKKSSRFTKAPEATPAGPPLIGALLRLPWESVRRRMLEHLHEGGFEDLEAAHLNLLQYPGPHGMRPSELAVRLGMSKQATNYLLGELERRGYLARGPDPDDLRSKRIVLTGRGKSAVSAIREAVGDTEREWAEKLGPRRFAQLRSLLVELNELA